ncbi:MAG: ABC transporter substrate-binding protein [Symploca sp. SIO2G7]|nr:ABC transporter substrate-binding protein [Symploca sp. SIO2G7]
MSLVVIAIGQGDFQEGFPVTLEIWKNNRIIQQHPNCSPLPSSPDIPRLYDEWKNTYDELGRMRQLERTRGLGQTRQIDIEPGQIINVAILDECQEAANVLESYVIAWFGRASFIDLRGRVLGLLKRFRIWEDDSIRIIFNFNTRNRGQDALLRKLPWHLWDLLEFLDNAEVSLIGKYNPIGKPLKLPVKILGIFGSSEGNLQLEEDEEALNELEQYGAEINLLRQPRLEVLHNNLWNQSWDILFFAGHSSSEAGRRSGCIQIGDNSSLSLKYLKEDLREAVKKGLKLAIFNSCDGLGIADFLADVGIPAIIVMREPVPDIVARRFLEYFLTEFVTGKPLYPAVREARRQLQWMEAPEDDSLSCPCASWLPIICQNPTALEISWPSPPEIPSPEIENILPPETPLKQFLNLVRQNGGKVAVGLAAAIAITLISYKEIYHKPPSVPPVKFSWGEELLTPPSTNSDKPGCKEAYSKKAEGQKAFEEQNFSEAVEHFQSFVEQCPYDPEARIYLNNAKAEYSENPIRIAVSVPIDSHLSPFIYQGILRGVAQAQEEFNERDGINNRLLKIGIADDKGNYETARRVAQLFVTDNDIMGVIGHYSSDTTLRAGKIYKKEKLVAISPTSTAVRGTNKAGDEVNFSPYVFRTASTDATAAKNLVNYMRNTLNYEKAAIVYESKNLYSRSIRRQFKEQLEAKGGTVVSDANSECNLSSTTFHPDRCIEKAIDNDAQVLLLAPSTKLSNQARQLVWNNFQRQNPLALLGGDAVYGTDTLENAGTAVEGMVIAISWHSNEDNPSEFEQEAQRLWREGIYLQAAMGYDATQVLIKGLTVLEQQDNNLTRKGLKQVLSNPDFSAEGATGKVEFNSSGDRKPSPNLGVLVQVQPDPESETGGYKFELLE